MREEIDKILENEGGEYGVSADAVTAIFEIIEREYYTKKEVYHLLEENKEFRKSFKKYGKQLDELEEWIERNQSEPMHDIDTDMLLAKIKELRK